MKREKSLWILAIIALLFLVFWNLRSHAAPLDASLLPANQQGIPKGCPSDHIGP